MKGSPVTPWLIIGGIGVGTVGLFALAAWAMTRVARSVANANSQTPEQTKQATDALAQMNQQLQQGDFKNIGFFENMPRPMRVDTGASGAPDAYLYGLTKSLSGSPTIGTAIGFVANGSYVQYLGKAFTYPGTGSAWGYYVAATTTQLIEDGTPMGQRGATKPMLGYISKVFLTEVA